MSLASSALTLWVGAFLLLGACRPVRRPSLARRCRPYVVPVPDAPRRPTWAGVTALVGTRLAPLGRGSLDERLRRTHHRLTPAAFRARQAGHAMIGLAATAAVVLALPTRLGPATAACLVLAAPLVVVAGHERQLAAADRAATRRLVAELPVVVEQLAMLLAAGRSVSAALAHLGAHGQGTCAADLRRLTRRLGQGVDEATALREWADLRPAPGVVHLVGVLTLAREAADLDRLVDQEAAAIRDDAHRQLLASLERRGQQVWVPVTVATLLPGSLLLLVPFLDALRLFAGP